MGVKPQPLYLKPGDVMRLGIEGLGEQQQTVHAWDRADRRLGGDGVISPACQGSPAQLCRAARRSHERVWSTPPVIRIHPADNVVIARSQLLGGTRLEREGVTVSGLVPPGHKVAVRAIRAGEPVRRYDQIIGFAKQDIAPGQHVHTHNLAYAEFARDYAAGQDAKPTEYVAEPATFDGHRSPRRPRGDAQLHRHPEFGELLGHGGARDRRPLPTRHPPRGARALPQRGRRGRADARRGLRHGQRWRGRCGCCAARSAATRGTPTSAP